MTIRSNINSHTQTTGWTSGQQRSPEYQNSSSKRGSSFRAKSHQSKSSRPKNSSPKGNVYSSSFANQDQHEHQEYTSEAPPSREMPDREMPRPYPEPHQGQIPQPFPEDAFYRIQTSPLRGANYYLDQEQLESLQVGQALQLHAEPANPYDKYAVRVHRGELHLGYLPRQSNHIVSRLLRQKAPLSARIAWVATDLENNPPITLEVMLEKPTSKQAQTSNQAQSQNPTPAEPEPPIRVTVS